MMSRSKNPQSAILQIIPNLNVGGAEKTCIMTANLLAQKGYPSYVASNGGVYESKLDQKVHLIKGPFHSKNPLKMIGNAARLTYLIYKHQIKIVHARSRAPAWSAWLACKFSPAIFVTTVHAPHSCPNPFKKLYNSVMVQGKYIGVVSQHIAEYVRKNYGITKELTLLYSGLDTNFYAPKKQNLELKKAWHIQEKDFVIITTSRLSRQKGHLDLIEALGHLKAYKQIKYFIVGPEKNSKLYKQDMLSLIEKLGIASQIFFTGPVQETRDVYRLADCFISPAHEEALGRTIIEALACETPSIITDIGAARELITDQETGFIVPAQNPKALAKAIENLIHMPQSKKNQMVEKARIHIVENFSNPVIEKKALQFYKKILKEA